MERIEAFLRKREKSGLLRALKPLSCRRQGKICFGGREYIDFSSNDYLGLSNHPKLIEAAIQALDKWGLSSSASRLMSGDLEIHHRLEEEVARFKNKEAGLIFNSGYQANTGIISALYGRGDCVFSDRLNHASIIDGILLSGARFFRFQHNDAGHLEVLLKKERRKFKQSLVVTETVFSMEGDRAPLKDLVDLKDKYNCSLMVDEAHATGIFGKDGSGVAEEENLSGDIELIMGTFGKALGGFGAYLATSQKIKEFLINACRSFIYSTALPAVIIAANLAALELLKEEPERRKSLLDSAQFFRQALKERGFAVRGSSQIVPLIIGENLKTVDFAQALQEKGYWVLPIRPPTVPKNQARLRFSLTTYHNKEVLERLVNDIGAIQI